MDVYAVSRPAEDRTSGRTAVNNNTNNNKGGTIIGIILVIVFVVIAFASCGGGSSSKRDIAHDPNGFLGYSDEFWDWYVENNETSRFPQFQRKTPGELRDAHKTVWHVFPPSSLLHTSGTPEESADSSGVLFFV